MAVGETLMVWPKLDDVAAGKTSMMWPQVRL